MEILHLTDNGICHVKLIEVHLSNISWGLLCSRQDIEFPNFRGNIPWSTCCYIGVVRRKSICAIKRGGRISRRVYCRISVPVTATCDTLLRWGHSWILTWAGRSMRGATVRRALPAWPAADGGGVLLSDGRWKIRTGSTARSAKSLKQTS